MPYIKLNGDKVILGGAALLPGQEREGWFLYEGPVFENSKWDGEKVVEGLPDPSVPGSVSPWQIRKALTQLGWRDAVEAAIEVSDQDTKDGWEVATQFERSNPLVIGLGHLLGKTTAEMDGLFILAATL